MKSLAFTRESGATSDKVGRRGFPRNRCGGAGKRKIGKKQWRVVIYKLIELKKQKLLWNSSPTFSPKKNVFCVTMLFNGKCQVAEISCVEKFFLFQRVDHLASSCRPSLMRFIQYKCVQCTSKRAFRTRIKKQKLDFSISFQLLFNIKMVITDPKKIHTSRRIVY